MFSFRLVLIWAFWIEGFLWDSGSVVRCLFSYGLRFLDGSCMYLVVCIRVKSPLK